MGPLDPRYRIFSQAAEPKIAVRLSYSGDVVEPFTVSLQVVENTAVAVDTEHECYARGLWLNGGWQCPHRLT